MRQENIFEENFKIKNQEYTILVLGAVFMLINDFVKVAALKRFTANE